jgi:3-deoxy-D-manno-octulosonate cytidylyltransferase
MKNQMCPRKVVIVIPARYASTRLPGKPLVDIIGKPMVQHVYERALQVPGVCAVVVATDDNRIADVVAGFGGCAVLTSPNHKSGTDRIVELLEDYDADIFVNLQGDEPLIRPADITTLINGLLVNPSVQVGTLFHILPSHEATNPNIVKVVVDADGYCLYFSRSPIPYPRDARVAAYLKHIGVYAYRRDVLQIYSSLVQPMVENAECLEQLRLLVAGIRIRAFNVEPTGPGVDTLSCLVKVRQLMAIPDIHF